MDPSRPVRATTTMTSVNASPLDDARDPAAAGGYAHLLLLRQAVEDGPELPALVNGLQCIEEAARHVARLLNELTGVLPFSGAVRANHELETIDLVDFVNRIAEESEATMLGRSRVVVLPAVAERVGWWDPVRLERMLANLIHNALKYNRHGRPVVVHIHPADNWAVISVADPGVGIPPAELTNVFDHGYRANNVAGHFSGSGLGLAGAHQIVAEHGGTISVDSRMGIGTTVTVRVPIGGATP